MSGFRFLTVHDAVHAQTKERQVRQISGIEHVRDATALIPAAMSSSGILAISRAELSAMDLFDQSGHFVGRIPRPQDQLSLVAPAHVAITPKGEILALDSRSDRLGYYALRGKDVVLRRVQQLDNSYADFCVLGRSLVMFTPEAGGRLDLLPLEQRASRRSIQLSSRRSVIEQPLNEGRLACDTDKQLIIFANSLDGSVRAFNLTQDKHWSVKIHDLKLPRVDLEAGRSIQIIPPAGAFHSLIQCVSVGHGVVLAQYMIHASRVPTWGEMAPILTVAIGITNGREVARTSTLPLIIAAAKRKIAYLGSSGHLIVDSTSIFVKPLPYQ